MREEETYVDDNVDRMQEKNDAFKSFRDKNDVFVGFGYEIWVRDAEERGGKENRKQVGGSGYL